VHRAERRFGPFLRSITLPGNVTTEAIDASAQDGVLLITVPKPKEAHAKRIQVHPGQVHTTTSAPVALPGKKNHS
jgi:HSP20 family protein